MNENQSIKSCEEQLLSARTGFNATCDYLCVVSNQCAKNIIIIGFTGRGKTFIMTHLVFHALSKDLTIVTFALMAHRATQLGS